VNRWTTGEIAIVVAAVRRAPSVRDVCPWVVEFHDGSVSLFELFDLWLPDRDRTGTDRLAACGAALTNLLLALRWLGWDLRCERFPNPARPDEVARVTTTGRRRPTEADVARYRAIGHRRGHRGPFGAPAPEPVVRELTAGVTVPGVRLQPVPGGLAVITAGDRREDRLLAGAALQEVWLDATRAGLAAAPAIGPLDHVGTDGFAQAALRLVHPGPAARPHPNRQRTHDVRVMEEASS
jgi:hypothetical protein